MLQELIHDYNNLHPDVRSEASVKAEWSLRADELVEKMWGMCDSRKEENLMEASRLVDTSFVVNNTFLIESLFVESIQVELDR